MSSKFEIFKSPKNNQFYFHLKASNGQIILQSEGYTTKSNCSNGVQSVKKNAPSEKAYDKKPKYFNLKSLDNGQIIGTSQQYSSESARDNGVESVQKNAPIAEVVDLTVGA
ncbi:YegP family protein [Orbus wheelerorum]|uniref:YegP family protein n=1 Tax=Orbus wheelerorum TaxID=3074111 RepID=UPI00370DA020